MEPTKQFEEGNALNFFDACQDFQKNFKFFKIEGRYDAICSGTMLGDNYKKSKTIILTENFQ